MSQPTEREREKAEEILKKNYFIESEYGYEVIKDIDMLKDEIAHALAQAREEGRAEGIRTAPCNCTECWLKRNDKGETE